LGQIPFRKHNYTDDISSNSGNEWGINALFIIAAGEGFIPKGDKYEV
jgi:hypothetical protein